VRGREVQVSVKLKPRKSEISSSDIFEMIFYRVRTGKRPAEEKNYAYVAKEVVKLAARKAEGLHDSLYGDMSKKFSIEVHEYWFILNKLSKLGIIRKTGHKYIATRSFAKHLRRMAMAMQEFCDDLGIPLEEDGAVVPQGNIAN
jgi:hypothetical protein